VNFQSGKKIQMAESKHRRKGKTRARVKSKYGAPLPISYRYLRHKNVLLIAQLEKKYGSNIWENWTDEQIDAALAEIETGDAV
jgi:hypothetical protein